ncbi:MAG: CapA family protein, partial [Candidatus Limnocylindria bacterium]
APTAARAAAATATPTAAPTARPDAYLVPVTRFGSPRDEVRLGELREVLVLAGWEDEVRALLPGASVTAMSAADAILEEVRTATDAIALLPPERVDASVRTLSVDGAFFWDRGLDLARYPLRVAGRGTADPERSGLWELVAGGGIVFGRGVQERIENRHGGDARPVFADVRALTRGADLAVATLEAPLSGDANRYCDRCLRFVGNERYVAALVDAGFDVLSLAANHIGDAGPQGVLDTMRVLDGAGIRHVGAGATEDAARRPLFTEVRGLRVAFLAYDDVAPQEYAATTDRPGHAWLAHDDPTYARVRAEVAAAKQRADLVVVVAHWGVEYEDQPRPWVVAAARAMVEAGAAVVIGDHPHWVQPVERYRGAYVAYSLGNFVFDQMWSARTRQGSLHRLWFDRGRLVSVRIVPTVLEDYYRPRPLDPTEPTHREVLERILRHSSLGG